MSNKSGEWIGLHCIYDDSTVDKPRFKCALWRIYEEIGNILHKELYKKIGNFRNK